MFIIWLAPRAGKMNQIACCDCALWLCAVMEPSCPLGTTCCIPQARLWTSTSSWSINTQKKNLANIQPSWPHTWSITHTYCTKNCWPIKGHVYCPNHAISKYSVIIIINLTIKHLAFWGSIKGVKTSHQNQTPHMPHITWRPGRLL